MLLLDTCTFIWLAGEPERLSPLALQLIEVHSEALFISAISIFEIGIKYHKGRLRLQHPLQEWHVRAMRAIGANELPVTGDIARLSTELPPLHQDPADRIIVATAQVENLPIITPDPLIAAYRGVTARW